ncbi:sensor histidine kinase [Nakamurella endophytica]|nr:ATP-binding protein [Nakamurella endophytica]
MTGEQPVRPGVTADVAPGAVPPVPSVPPVPPPTVAAVPDPAPAAAGPSSEEFRALLTRLDRAEQDERRRLSEAVHDGPLQLLSVAVLQLDGLAADSGSPALRGRLQELAGVLQDAVEMLRRITVAAALPGPDLDLAAAVRQWTAAVFAGTDTDVCVDARLGTLELEPHTRDTVYLVVREAVVNARKHAAPSRLAVRVVPGPRTVRICVDDDGPGIPADPLRAGHVGLPAMQARARELGGRLDWSSGGGGTTVTLVLPAPSNGRVDR